MISVNLSQRISLMDGQLPFVLSAGATRRLALVPFRTWCVSKRGTRSAESHLRSMRFNSISRAEASTPVKSNPGTRNRKQTPTSTSLLFMAST